MNDIVERLSIGRNSVSRGTTANEESHEGLVREGKAHLSAGVAGSFRVRNLPLARRRTDALPATEVGVKRP